MVIPNTRELCAGYGGLGLGLLLALGRFSRSCTWKREIFVARQLGAPFQDGTLASADIWTDVKTFDGKTWTPIFDSASMKSMRQMIRVLAELERSLIKSRAAVGGGHVTPRAESGRPRGGEGPGDTLVAGVAAPARPAATVSQRP